MLIPALLTVPLPLPFLAVCHHPSLSWGFPNPQPCFILGRVGLLAFSSGIPMVMSAGDEEQPGTGGTSSRAQALFHPPSINSSPRGEQGGCSSFGNGVVRAHFCPPEHRAVCADTHTAQPRQPEQIAVCTPVCSEPLCSDIPRCKLRNEQQITPGSYKERKEGMQEGF